MPVLMKLTKVLVIVLVVIGLLMASILAVISFIDVNQYKDTIAAQVEKLTGRELKLKGDLQFKAALSPTVIVEDAQFANATWGSRAQMVKIGRLEVQIRLIPLLTGDITVKRFVLIDPDIFLETDQQGKGNWQLDVGEAATEATLAEEQEPGLTIQLIDIRVENGKISYLDGASAESTTFHFERLTLRRAGPSELNVALSADYKGVALELKGKAGLIYNMLNNAPFPLQLEGTVGEMDITLQGRLERPMDVTGMDVTVSVEALDLATISRLAGQNIPKIGPLKLKARLTDSQNGYELDALALKLGNSELNGDVSLNLTGQRPALSARLNSRFIDLMPFAPDNKKQDATPPRQKTDNKALFDPVALGPLRSLDADIILDVKKIRSADLVLENLHTTVRLKNGRLDVKPLKLRFAGSDLDAVVSFEPFAKRPLLSARLDSKLIDLTPFVPDKKQPDSKQPQQKQQNSVSIDPAALAPLRSVDANITLNLDKLRTTDLELDNLQTIMSLKNGKLHVKPFKLRYAGSDLGGNVSFDPFAKRPSITARLNSNTLDLTAFQTRDSAQKETTAAKTEPEKQPETPEKLFSSDSFSLQPLRELDADVSLKAGELKTKDLVVHKLDLSLKLNSGKLELKPLEFVVAGGGLKADIILNASRQTVQVTTDVTVEQVELGRIESIQKLIKGSKSNASIKLTGRGESVKDIMAGLNGSLAFEVGKGSVVSKHVNLLGSDLLVEVVQKVNPLSKKGETSRLECAVVKFDVKDGVASIDRGIALQTDKMNVIGSGSLDLRKEHVDLSLRPIARKGLGIGAGELAQLVRVAGPLADPGLTADAKGVVKLGATIGAAVATAGTSYLAQKLISRTIRDDTPCLTALSKTPTPTRTENGKGLQGGVKKLWKGTKSLLEN